MFRSTAAMRCNSQLMACFLMIASNSSRCSRVPWISGSANSRTAASSVVGGGSSTGCPQLAVPFSSAMAAPRWLSKTVSLAVFPVIFSFSMSFFALVKFLGVVPRQRWPPAKPDPLLDVVGQARPEHFQQHLGQTAQTELAQSQFFLDPGIGKF